MNIDAGMGDIEVLIPSAMNVRTRCEVSVGSFDCLPTPVGTGPVLTINATANVGSIEVRRV
ncbi:Uncharacterised protein [Mycobacteroides abscessus subsp. abscessus]|nr:Uncharacterised protein [Mycobacteroides abscessus subsp. abscessus]